jgi:hypothetical protein
MIVWLIPEPTLCCSLGNKRRLDRMQGRSILQGLDCGDGHSIGVGQRNIASVDRSVAVDHRDAWSVREECVEDHMAHIHDCVGGRVKV